MKKNNIQEYGKDYLDVGCSNGYITNLISRSFEFDSTKGVDHSTDNLEIAKEKYPTIKFEFIDLNKLNNSNSDYFNLVTCFETLEHVGNLNNAVLSIISFAAKGKSLIIIGVPIEIGFWGVVKFLIKKSYGYSQKELPNNIKSITYFIALIKGQNISKFRDTRDGWGTHFGFDYRNIDKILTENNILFSAKNSFTTKFYTLKV